MPHRLQFNESLLNSVIGGHSAIDLPRLNFKTMDEANAFIQGYGFNPDDPEEMEKLWYYHRRSLVLVQEKLGFAADEIPEKVRDPKVLQDVRKLLLYASASVQAQGEERELQRWSCALLRVMHVFVHSENDLFSSFAEEIQKQILAPFQACILHDGTTGKTFLRRPDETTVSSLGQDPIALAGFEVKPFKTSSSTVIKLLAKPDALALNVLDKLGVRFIATSLFDVFRVVRFLIHENLVSFPQIIPDQSSNNLYPVEIFLQGCEEILPRVKNMSNEEVNHFLQEYLEKHRNEGAFLRKENVFSGGDYQFIKFISRKFIRVEGPSGRGNFSFFYPFEVQIMDQSAHQKILSGPSAHQAYKKRQRLAARHRLFPDVENP
jgi:uncharacterized protein (TIGR04552 family)